MAREKQALYGDLSKPTRIGHSIRHKVQKLLPDGNSKFDLRTSRGKRRGTEPSRAATKAGSDATPARRGAASSSNVKRKTGTAKRRTVNSKKKHR